MSAWRCARCRRTLLRPGVLHPPGATDRMYGPTCAVLLGIERPAPADLLLPSRPPRRDTSAQLALIVSRRRIHKPDPLQPGLFDEGAPC